MRTRRPYLFSDTRSAETAQLSKEVFEYHLESLTSRKEETSFEHFARRLCEKEICPNLIPQTGPTGGGDSKVDSETYPVANQLSRTWYTGINHGNPSERWGFAFSAKKDWCSKVKSDISNIASTGRDYKRVFFVTNQFVPDKKRATVEEQLTAKFGFAVSILDRSWIVEKTFGNNRIDLAIDALGMKSNLSKETIQGPQDARRETEIRELDRQIEDVDRYRGVEYQLAEACLESAVLARGLGRSRAEIDGRFERAGRIAESVNHAQQKLRIAYTRAWSAFWWFEDFSELNRLYSDVETLAKDSTLADDIEYLLNLWQLLRTSVLQGKIDESAAYLEARTQILTEALDRLAGDSERPNNSTTAKTDRLIVDLSLSLGNPDATSAALNNLTQVVETSDHLINYPLTRLYDLIGELGDMLPDSEAFDRLFEALTSRVEKRSGEGRAGEAFLRRGFQKLKGNLPYDAIRLFGRAQHKLTKREYRGELVSTLAGSAAAYENVGLLWAARSSALAAAHFAFLEFQENGKIVRPAFRSVQTLVWLEIQLGRIPPALAWSELLDVLTRHIEVSDARPGDDFADERESRDAFLSNLFLRASMDQLRELEFMPGVLERLNLPFAQVALLYSLGYEDYLRNEGWIPESEDSSAVMRLYQKLIGQDDAKRLPERPELLNASRIVFRTILVGCRIEIDSGSDLDCIFLAESILGALEAFLATSLARRIFPNRAEVRISINESSNKMTIPTLSVNESDGSIEILNSGKSAPDTPEAQKQYSDWLMEAVLRVFAHFAFVRDIDAFMAQIIGEEKGFERAINNAHVRTVITNIMGATPRFRLSDWRETYDARHFPLKRQIVWNAEFPKGDDKKPGDDKLTLAKGDPPPEMLDFESARHSEIEISSIIDDTVWNKAGWSATVFGHMPGRPPILGFGFKNRDAAAAIFSNWRKRYGETDVGDEIRISILTGVDRSNLSAYRVIVGGKLKVPKDGAGRIVLASRINSMNPLNSHNLDLFISTLSKARSYFLVPAVVGEPQQGFDFMMSYAILKSELVVRPAWQIGENDQDVMGIRAEDDPVLPDGVDDIPVLRTLQRVRSRSVP